MNVNFFVKLNSLAKKLIRLEHLLIKIGPTRTCFVDTGNNLATEMTSQLCCDHKALSHRNLDICYDYKVK